MTPARGASTLLQSVRGRGGSLSAALGALPCQRASCATVPRTSGTAARGGSRSVGVSAGAQAAPNSGSEAAAGVAIETTGEPLEECLQAEHRLGFGFSAGGMLFPYLIGVVKQLNEEGIMTGAPSQPILLPPILPALPGVGLWWQR